MKTNRLFIFLLFLSLMSLTDHINAQWSGSGTESDPYQITTSDNLKQLSLYVMNDPDVTGDITSKNTYGKHWKVMDNINMAGISDFVPIGGWGTSSSNDENHFFAGVFDGNNKKIINLTISKNNAMFGGLAYVSLFGIIKGNNARVENLGIEAVSFTGRSSMGALAGINGGTIQNCYSSGTVNGNYGGVGGLVGENSGIISNCYSTSAVNGFAELGWIGGFIGNNSGTVSNCYSAPASFDAHSVNYGGLLIDNNSGTIINSYYRNDIGGYDGIGVGFSMNVTGIPSAEMKSLNFAVQINGSQFPARWKFHENDYPLLLWQLKDNSIELPLILSTAEPTNLTSSNATFNGMAFNGTQTIISKGFEWKASENPEWSSLSADGTGFTYLISELNPGTRYEYRAIASTSNLTFYGPVIYFNTSWQGDGTESSPFLVRSVENLKTLSSYVMNNKTTSGMFWKLMNDINMEVITDFVPIGGWKNSDNSDGILFFSGTFDGNGKSILNLVINKSSNDYVGLFGNTGDGSKIMNLGLRGGTVTGRNWVGGLVGYNYYGTIINCSCTASVIGNDVIGGLVGCTYGPVINSYSGSSVTGAGIVGGLVGANTALGSITNCYSKAIVNSEGYEAKVGGLIGKNILAISNCYSRASISASGLYATVGGLAGLNYGYINGIYTIIGTISNCYSSPISFNATSNVKGLFAGENSGEITNSYYCTELVGFNGIGTGSVTGSSGKTAEEMKESVFVATLNAEQSPYPWDKDNSSINNGYPVLVWQNPLSTSLKNDLIPDNLVLFPNPAHNIAKIKGISEKSLVTVTDQYGLIQYSHTISENEAEINLSGFKKGIYLIKINNRNGIRVLKLIIN